MTWMHSFSNPNRAKAIHQRRIEAIALRVAWTEIATDGIRC
jgi:hypothetical protein